MFARARLASHSGGLDAVDILRATFIALFSRLLIEPARNLDLFPDLAKRPAKPFHEGRG